MWHEFQETEERLVRSFAGPPGLEDATRTEATRDRVVDTEYPNHGALRLTMPRAFRNAGLHTRWLLLDYSLFSPEKDPPIALYPHLSIHESSWSRVFSSLAVLTQSIINATWAGVR